VKFGPDESQYAFEGGPLHLDIENSGSIFAVAHAQGSNAFAEGVGIFAFSNFAKDGTIFNSGRIYGSAFASGARAEAAHAVGVWDPSQINNVHTTNTGLINAYAQVSGGATEFSRADATGILVSNAAGQQGAPGGVVGHAVNLPDPTAL